MKCMLVIDVVDLLPQFGLIKDVLVLNNIPYFCYKLIDTICFNHHFHSYEISIVDQSDVNFITHFDLIDYHPLTISQIPSDPNIKFIRMKYHIVERNIS